MSNWTRHAALWAGPAVLAVAIGFRIACGPPHWLTPPSGGERRTSPGLRATARLEAKSRMADEVIAGRLSLLEAAAGFKALDAAGPPAPGWVFPERPPDVSDDEYYCRMVIEFVRGTAAAGEADDAVCPLQAELDARLRDGTLHLPGPPLTDPRASE
jgi:hypothetical protein